MSRPIYVISYDSRLFPAHWALWVPRLDDAALGKLIDVAGDPRAGFEHRVVRNAPIAAPHQRYKAHELGRVDGHLVVDDTGEPGDGAGGVVGNEPADALEALALSVPAPVKSLRDAADEVSYNVRHHGPPPHFPAASQVH
jgi:hypothetical protein